MSRSVKLMVGLLLVLAFTATIPALAQTEGCQPPFCFMGEQASGAKYLITLPPSGWNGDGDLVIFAHGYVSVLEPVEIPWSQMIFTNGNGLELTLPDLVNLQGFAFATTSYSVNGLAVKEGIADILDLIDVFEERVGSPGKIYLVGASEGGLITTLAVEGYPGVFSGAMAICGPIGSFIDQVNYWGDFRVVFDYLMDTPELNVLPGNAASIPAVLMKQWDTEFVPRIGGVLAANPTNTLQLMPVAAPHLLGFHPSTIGPTTLGILWYNVFATEDAIDKLGGRPFDNFDHAYVGSWDDAQLNAKVKRFKAQPAALKEIQDFYETSGEFQTPLVTMHTTGDPIVPVWHQAMYSEKVWTKHPTSPLLPMPPIERYGHCNFTLEEILTGFGFATGQIPVQPLMMMEKRSLSEVYYYDYNQP